MLPLISDQLGSYENRIATTIRWASTRNYIAPESLPLAMPLQSETTISTKADGREGGEQDLGTFVKLIKKFIHRIEGWIVAGLLAGLSCDRVYRTWGGFVFPNGSGCDAAIGLMPGLSSSLVDGVISVVGVMGQRPAGRFSFRLTVWLFSAIHWPVIAADLRRT